MIYRSFLILKVFIRIRKRKTFVKWDNRNKILDLKIKPPLDLKKVYPFLDKVPYKCN